MRYNRIRKMDISNGPGVRVSIFMQGCTFNCKGCFNQETHDFDGGKPFTKDIIRTVLELSESPNIKGISILGGEPLHIKNADGTLKLAHEFKEKYKDKNIWVWTGFLFEDLKKLYDLSDIDVLVDGQFKEELHNPTLKWKGSSNQRVIDVKRSLKEEKIVLYEK